MPWLLLCLLVAGLLAYALSRHFKGRSGLSRGQAGALSPPAPNSWSMDAKTMKAFLAIEAQRNQIDQTVWAEEWNAQRHEDIFVRLWDELRTKEDSFAVFQSFEFGEVALGTFRPAETNDHAVVLTRFGAPAKRLRPPEWRALMERLKADGYRLQNSEWRHARFQAQTNAAAASTFWVSLHAIHPGKQGRFVLRGELKVTWRTNVSPSAEPFPELIDASGLEFLSVQGRPAFDWVLAREINPEENPIFIDPLILYDLNGDGLSEIVLGCKNRVHWNLGGGRFQTTRLSPYYTNTINAAMLADFTGDASADFLAADAMGFMLYRGDPQGRFAEPGRRIRFTDTPLLNAFVMTAGDIDGDGDLDVWLAQYKLPYVEGQMPTPYYDANDGFPAFLLVNDGQGRFQDRTEASGLAQKRFRRTYSGSLIDLDDDQDLDLFVVSDFAGVDVYFNDGRGQFKEATSQAVDDPHLFGMAHTFGDYDLDGKLDCFAIGMNSFVAGRLDSLGLGPSEFALHQQMRPKMAYGNRLYLQRDQRWQSAPLSDQAARSGWSWGATTFDFDNDADLDLYIANGHKSRASVKEYETQFWRHDIYAATSKHDPALDSYFRGVGSRLYGAGGSYGGYHKNRLLMNRAGRSFLEIGHLMGVALELDCRNAVSDDLDGDGKMDLLVTSLEEWPQAKQGLHLFQNRCQSAGNWIGFRLREHGPGLSPVGAKITLHSPARKQTRHLVTGDSYRSQHANTAHFGLGTETNIAGVEIRWPNGRINWIARPAVNRYHDVPASQDSTQ